MGLKAVALFLTLGLTTAPWWLVTLAILVVKKAGSKDRQSLTLRNLIMERAVNPVSYHSRSER
jgi:hypothetical protein